MKQLLNTQLIDKTDLNINNSNEDLIIRTNDIIARIKGITNQIQSIAGNSEHDILQIGNKLQNFLSDSKELFQMSSSVTSLITYEVLQKGVLDLNGLLSEFTRSD